MITKWSDSVKGDELRRFLGDLLHGGGPKDSELVEDWPAFVARHTDSFGYHLFSYDKATDRVCLSALVSPGASPKPNLVCFFLTSQ